MPSAPTAHFLLTASSVWTKDHRVLGIFETELEALEAAAPDRFLADLTGPVRFSVEQWEDSHLVRSLTSSPPFEAGGDALSGWVETG